MEYTKEDLKRIDHYDHEAISDLKIAIDILKVGIKITILSHIV